MILLLHVIIAFSSIGAASYAYIRPTKNQLRANYGLIALTLVSGFILVWVEPAQMLRACMSGVAYTTIVTAGLLLARRKLSLFESSEQPS